VLEALSWCDGVMLGREAYHRPHLLAELSAQLHPNAPTLAPSRTQLLERMAGYADEQMRRGEHLASITRHMLGLCAGEPGAREYRRLLSEGARAVPVDAARLLRHAAALLHAVPRAGAP
jgi:tRNA-dihydrouridine synthase A